MALTEYQQERKKHGAGGELVRNNGSQYQPDPGGKSWLSWRHTSGLEWVPYDKPPELNAGAETLIEEMISMTSDGAASMISSDRREDRISYQAAGFPNNGPCYFRTLLAIAETKTGRNLSGDEIKTAYKELTESGIFVANAPYDVKDTYAVIDWALKRLYENYKQYGVRRYKAYPGSMGAAEATAIRGQFSSNGDIIKHWVEGDKSGGFRWDPSRSGGVLNRLEPVLLEIRYFTFSEVKP